LRLLPAVFGIVAVPLMFLLGKRLFGARAGLLAATLVAFSPWHIYWSQYGRYYTLVFLLSATFPILLFTGVQGRSPRVIMAGVALAVLAILAHPSAGLVLAGCGVWLTLRSGGLSLLLSRRLAVRVAAALAALATCIVAYRLIIQLRQWYNLSQDWGFDGVTLVLSYLVWLVPVLVVFSVAGIIWMWLEFDRPLASLLAISIGVPIILLVPLSFVVPVSTSYLFATAPFAFLAAAFFLDRLAAMGPRIAHQEMLMIACLVAVLVAGGPGLISHYVDGNRADFRAAAQFVVRHATDDGTILSDQARVLAHYLDSRPVLPLRRDVSDLTQDIERARSETRTEDVWLVVAIKRRGGFYEQGLGTASHWFRGHCELRSSFGRPRLDHKHNELQVYHCTRSPGSAGTQSDS